MEANRAKHEINSDGAAIGGNVETNGGGVTGRDDIGGDHLSADVGDVTGPAVVASKNVRQRVSTRTDSPDVTVNNYERGGADLVDRLEERLEAQINRLSDNVSARISTFESNMNWKLELVDRDIDALKHNASRLWLPLLTVIASLVIAAAMFYFGGGLYSLSNELKQQRIESQKSGVIYGKPQGIVGMGER